MDIFLITPIWIMTHKSILKSLIKNTSDVHVIDFEN